MAITVTDPDWPHLAANVIQVITVHLHPLQLHQPILQPVATVLKDSTVHVDQAILYHVNLDTSVLRTILMIHQACVVLVIIVLKKLLSQTQLMAMLQVIIGSDKLFNVLY